MDGYYVKTERQEVADFLRDLAKKVGRKISCGDNYFTPYNSNAVCLWKGDYDNGLTVSGSSTWHGTNWEEVSIDKFVELLNGKTIKIGIFKVVFNKGQLNIGCQKIPNAVVRKIAKRLCLVK